MKCVVHSFLDSFTSRNSDLHGYWLFGQLSRELTEARLDLLKPPRVADAPLASAHAIAARRFTTLVSRSGLSLDLVRSATLEFTRQPALVLGRRGDSVAEGNLFCFVAHVTMDHGPSYRAEREAFVAPHDPGLERRRDQSHWG
jgi:hypothetical protein